MDERGLITTPGRIRLGPEAERTCVFQFTVSKDHWRDLLQAGLWWIVPLGHRRDQPFGIRIVPGQPLRDCPIVSADGGYAATQVARPAYLMPWLIWPGSVVDRESWDSVLRASEEAWRQLGEAHAALGGDDALAGIRSVLADDRLARASVIEGNDGAFTRAYREIRTRIDTDPETADFCRLLEWGVQSSLAPAPLAEAPLPSSPGACWRAASASIMLSLSTLRRDLGLRPERPLWTQDDYPAAARAAAWELLRQPSGLDCFQRKSVTLIAGPGDSPAQMIQAARLLAAEPDECPREWRGDPWWPCVLSMAEEGERYAGLTHLDAATALADAGRREEAFDALTSSAYWFSRATGEANPALASAAQLLAAESGWIETEQALAFVAEAINAAVPALDPHRDCACQSTGGDPRRIPFVKTTDTTIHEGWSEIFCACQRCGRHWQVDSDSSYHFTTYLWNDITPGRRQ